MISYIGKVMNILDAKLIFHIHSRYTWLKGNNRDKTLDSYFRKNMITI